MLPQTKQLLESTGLTNKLLAESRDSLTEKLGDKLEERFMAAIVNNVPEDKMPELEKKLSNKDDDVTEYLQTVIPSYQEMIQEELRKFKEDVDKAL